MRTHRDQYIVEISCYTVLYRFLPYLIMVKNHFKNQIILISQSGLGSSPKSNQFVLATHQTCPPSFVRIRPQPFEISCYISVSPNLSMVKNHLKNYQIRIFTKIESVPLCHTPNMSTKIRRNPSTTF